MKSITIGKYTLESLTTGMYVDPLILFREYIQNSADSIDEAILNRLITKDESCIKIKLSENEVLIEDNGTGIKIEKAFQVLTDIGNSQKRFSNNKGFRGIGRLSGLSYCEKLIFETSFYGESKKSIIIFDCLKLNELLIPGKYEQYSIKDVIESITVLQNEEENLESHYMKVRLINVNKKLGLLDEEKIVSYIEEIAPIPFNKSFNYGDKINNTLEKLGLSIDEYNIFIETDKINKQIYKPYKNKIYVDLSNRVVDEISDIELKVITDDAKDKVIALVWYGKTNLKGTVVDNSIKGLRVRKSGILIGDRFLLNPIFKEERFNGWIVGEVIIIDNDIIPNARRDDFEKNDEYIFLMNELKKIGKKITNEIREASKLRNKEKFEEVNVVNKNKVIDEISVTTLVDANNSIEIFEKMDKLFNIINDREIIARKVEAILKVNDINDEIIEVVLNEIKL